jgi:hypothetical protein
MLTFATGDEVLEQGDIETRTTEDAALENPLRLLPDDDYVAGCVQKTLPNRRPGFYRSLLLTVNRSA